MTIKEINKVSNFLTKYLDKELPARLSFSIAKFCLSAEDNQKLFAEKNLLLAQKYGEQNEDGNYIIPQDKIPEFTKEYNALENIDIPEVNLSLSFEDLEKLELTPREFAILMPYITGAVD